MKMVKRNGGEKVRKIAMGVVIVLILALSGWMILKAVYTDERVARDTLEELAEEYYETEYYEAVIAAHTDASGKVDFEEVFGKASESGFAPVKLRQLLLFGGGKHSGERVVFDREHYKCDTNKTEVVYTPVAPYQKKDYTVEYRMSCEEL